MVYFKQALFVAFLFLSFCLFSQTFNWNAYPTNSASWVSSPTFSVTKATGGGGSFDVRSSSAAGTSAISGTSGNTAQNCGTYTGLRIEMSGAGNSAGSAAWNNNVTVTLNFPTFLCAPVTFNIYDITETFYNDGTANYVNYQDKVTISALDNVNNPVTPGAAAVGGIDNLVSGTSRVLIANGTSAQCMNQAITVGAVGQQIKQITIIYSNQDPPTHCPAPIGSPPRYGISQYQYIFISPITGASAPTATISSPALACGTTSTTLTATTSAGSPTYSWTGPGGSTVTSPTSSVTAVSGVGVYTLVVNPGGCSGTATYTIASGGTPPGVTASSSNTLTCTNTTVQAIVSTTSTPVTYNWSGPGITAGATTASATVNAPGTYNYTVTNTSSGCSTTGTLAITQNTSVVTASTSVTNSLNCTTTTAQVIATTTTSPVSYVWSGSGITSGAGTATINVNQGGTFNYTVTNTGNGCKTTGSQAVTQNTVLPNPTASPTGSITCSTSTVALNGGPAALTYTWSGPGFSGGTNSQNAVATTSGSYTLTVTGTNGCTKTAVTTVGTNTALPTPTASSSGSITCSTSTVALNGGPAALTYMWSGPGFSGGTNSQNAVANASGSYTLSVTGANGCTNTTVTSVATNTTAPAATASLATAITCTSTSATLQGGPLSGVTYSWTGAGLTGATNQATATITSPGTYTLTTTSTVNGCINTAVVTPTANLTQPQVSVVPDLTINCVTPTALLEGSSTTPGVTYAWTGPTTGTPAGSTPTNSTSVVSAPGNYTLTVTNPSNACTSSAVIAVTSNVSIPNISVGSSQTITCISPSAVLTGSSSTSPVNYSWTGPIAGNPAGSTPTNSTTTINAGGNYTLTITNPANSCTNSAVVSIIQNTTPPSITATNTSTLTCATLTANIVGTGGGTYSWSGPGITAGATSSSATINLPGTYTLLVTAASGCTATANTSVTQNTTTPTASASNTSTLTCVTLTANVTGTGGGNYNWSGPGIVSGGTTATPVVNKGGTYVVTVTAANGCTATANTSITQNTTTPSASATNASTLNCTTTTAVLTATGGGTYNWSGPGITAGATTSTPTVNLPGTYNLTVTAANGCTATANTSITQNTVTPSVSTATGGVLNCTLTSVNASATTTTSPVSYSWSGSGITSASTISTVTVNQGGTYTYTVTNTNNGCKTSGSVSVTQNTTSPSASAVGGTLTCANTSTTLAGGPASGVTYSWLGAGLSGATNLANATATTTGNYTLITTSTTNGCTNTAVATVTNNLNTPTANAGSTQTLVCGVSSVTLTGTGTPIGSTANWLGGVCGTTNNFTTTACAPGTYTLVATDPTSGCSNSATVAVSSSTDVPQATVNVITNSITCTNSVVAIGVTLSNTDPVSYSWTGPGISGTNNTAGTTATIAGTYSVTITNTVSNCQSVFNLVVPTNTTTPSALANSSNTITCSTTSITLSATPTGTNYAYTWSGPGTITNGTTASPGVNMGGTYTVTVTDNINGCIAIGTVNVVTNTVSPTMTLTPSSLTTTCANPTATLLATSSVDPDVNYVWTVPATGSLSNTTINNPVANGSGVFTVQVTNTVSGCVSATETVTITADANIPTLNATSTQSTICSNQTTTLAITGADTYTWSTLETTSTITVSPNQTTTYSVTGTNTLTGCSNITNVTVSVTPTPTLGVVATTTTVCDGNSTILTLTGATNYTVTNPQQTTTNTMVLTPTVQTTYTITGELQGCASTTETITINVSTLPVIAVSNQTTCAGSMVTLSATGADTYTWSTTANTNTISVSPTTNANYTLTGTNTLTGCTSTVTTVDVTVNALPTVTVSANPNTTCTSGTVNLTANTTATSYTWTAGNGITFANQNQGNISFGASTLTTGTYVYTVTVTSADGCVSVPATTTLTIIDVPNANFDLSDLSICQNANGTISINTPQSGVSYDWNINGQSITNTNPLIVPTSVTGTAGTYSVSVIAGIGTCTNTASNTLTVNALPAIALVNPTTSACENTAAQLDVAGPNSTYNYTWTNGQNTGTGSGLTVNPLTQENQGTYTVTATDANGCTNRTTGKIDIIICETFVPEFFSPNGDGTNDGFVIKNIENYPNNQLKIFNRWGNLIYQKDAYLNEFAGFANVGDAAGKEKLPAGTYYVILVYGDEKTETYNGYLLLQY